jgi:hypothetical protein
MSELDKGSGPEPMPILTSKFWQTVIGRILQVPLTILILLYFLFDDLVLSWLRPIYSWAGKRRIFVRFAVWIHHLGPYQALLLFAVPFILLEPFKVGGLVLVGMGKVKAGGIMLAASHLLSLLIVERLFHVTREKLLTIGWFAWGFRLVMAVKDWAFDRLKRTAIWRGATAIGQWLRPRLGALVTSVITFWRWLAERARANSVK